MSEEKEAKQQEVGGCALERVPSPAPAEKPQEPEANLYMNGRCCK